MKTCSQTKAVWLAVLFGVTGAGFIADLPAGPEQSPQIADVRSNHEKAKTPTVNEALERCLADLSKAQNELRSLYAEGKVERSPDVQDKWQAYVKFTNGDYSLVFESSTGPCLVFRKAVFADKGSPRQLLDLGYEVFYYSDGKIKAYHRRNFQEGVELYPNGGIDKFWGEIDEHTSCKATWDADGKLIGEGFSTQLSGSETNQTPPAAGSRR